MDQRHLKIKRRPGNAKPEFIAKHTQPNESVAVPSQSSQGATKESTPRSGLRRIAVDEVPPLHRDPVDPRARAIADEILTDIRSEGEPALLRHAIRLGDIKQGESHVMLREDLKKYYDSLPEAERSNLNRTADRIKQFAEAQVRCVSFLMCLTYLILSPISEEFSPKRLHSCDCGWRSRPISGRSRNCWVLCPWRKVRIDEEISTFATFT